MSDVSAKRVCVIGSGTMGCGIAAHLANLGFDVDLLGLTDDDARQGLERAKSLKPPQFYGPNAIARIEIGNTTSNLDRVGRADWVCEAIFEKLDAKRALFSQIESLIAPNALISTNTSGLQIQLLAEGRSESFRKKFLGTHFFNPPRYLKLLELIPTEETLPDEMVRAAKFLEDFCGRRVVVAKDTPGFIANRYGMWAMIHAIHVAEKLRLTIEEVDAITGPFLGRPRSASFRLNDLVGLDIMADIADNLYHRCPHDHRRDQLVLPRSLRELLDRGWIGQKSGQGYYRKEGKEFMALDLTTLAYRNQMEPDLPTITELGKLPLGERIANALSRGDQVGEFLRLYLIPTLIYAEELRPEISHSVEDFDRVMKWGFGWQMGPFEMIDAIGEANIGLSLGKNYHGGQMRADGGKLVDRKTEPEFRSIDEYPVLDKKSTFTVRDLGHGVVGLSLTTKMGTINPTVVTEMTEFLKKSSDAPLVLTSEARWFSAGFDLNFFAEKADASAWEAVDQALTELQQLSVLLSQRKSVAAVFGYCLGAGMELAMGCRAILAHPESQIGLPEIKVGLIPGGAGTVRMRNRHQTSAKDLVDIIKCLSVGFVSDCADQAARHGYLRTTDVIGTHPDRVIHDAALLALGLPEPPPPFWSTPPGPLAGMLDQALQELASKGDIAGYDLPVAEKLKHVFAKSTSWDDALNRERAEFIDLLRGQMTHARIRHMLDTGKPLRN